MLDPGDARWRGRALPHPCAFCVSVIDELAGRAGRLPAEVLQGPAQAGGSAQRDPCPRQLQRPSCCRQREGSRGVSVPARCRARRKADTRQIPFYRLPRVLRAPCSASSPEANPSQRSALLRSAALLPLPQPCCHPHLHTHMHPSPSPHPHLRPHAQALCVTTGTRPTAPWGPPRPPSSRGCCQPPGMHQGEMRSTEGLQNLIMAK